MPEAWRLFALFSLQAKNKAMERKAAKFQTLSWDVMVQDNWWWGASAAIKQGKLQSFDCWIRLKIVVHSTRLPVSTVPHGGQILVYPTSKQFLMVVRSWCIPPVSTEPHVGQIMVHPTSQHRASWRLDLGASHQSAQSLMAVRSWCIPPVSTEPHGGQILVHSTSQHRASWRSDLGTFHQSAQSLMSVRSWYIPPVSTEPHGGEARSLWGKGLA